MGDHELTSDAAYQNLLARISDVYATGQYPKGQKPSDLLSWSHHVELNMPDSYDSLLIQMKECAASLHELQRQAAQSCALVVNDLIRTKSQDADAIKRNLRGLGYGV